MKKQRAILLLLIGLFVSLEGFSQSALDSLEQELSVAGSDSIRFTILLQLSQEYEHIDFLQSRQYAQQAMGIAENMDWKWAKADAFDQQGYLASLNGDYGRALMIDSLNFILVREMNDSARMVSSFNSLGDDHLGIGEFAEAYYYFTQSYRVAANLEDSLGMAIALHNVGSVLKELGQYDIAVNHLELSRRMSERMNDQSGRAYYLDEIGDIHLREGRYEEAEVALLEALETSRVFQIPVLEPEVLLHLANLYNEVDELDKALLYYDSTSQLHAKTSNQFGQGIANLGKGKVFVKKGMFQQGQTLLETTLASARSLNANTLVINCIEVLASLFELQGEYEKSVDYYKEYIAKRDSLFSKEMLERLFQDQLRFETETKDQEIASLNRTTADQESEIKLREFITNILAVVTALSAILLVTVYRNGKRKNKIRELLLQHQDELRRRSVELEQLNQVKDKFFSIISHDLRSPINALSSILDLLDNKNLSGEEFTQLTQELRKQFTHTKALITNLLDWTLLQMDKLQIQPTSIDLKKIVDDNITLLGPTQVKEIKLVNNVPESAIGYGDPNMINLVFRNLILNGVKFTETGGQITISAKDDGDHLTVSIADNGVGIDPEVQRILFQKTSSYTTRGTANEKGTGLGLILCKEFVEKNGGTIWLESELGKGSVFYFTLKKKPSGS